MKLTKIVLGVVIPIGAFGQTSTGAIQGSVTGDDGARIASAVVRYQRITRKVVSGRNLVAAPGEAVIFSRTSTDANGGFSIGNLPVGDYALCVESASLPYLNPCLWSGAPKIAVSTLEISRPSLVLKKGVFLRVRINDSQALLPPVPKTALGGSNLKVGVIFGSGGYHGAELIAADRFGRDYRIAIPTDLSLKLRVFSRHVTLTDSSGDPVDQRGSQIPLEPKAGQDLIVTLNVTGRVSGSAQ